MAPDTLDPNDPDARRLAELQERLKEVRSRGAESPKGGRTDTSLGIAFRMSVEFVAAVVVGAGLGWLLDRFFGTSPFLMILFFFLGAGTGFYNVIRSAGRMDQDQSTRSDEDGPDRK